MAFLTQCRKQRFHRGCAWRGGYNVDLHLKSCTISTLLYRGRRDLPRACTAPNRRCPPDDACSPRSRCARAPDLRKHGQEKLRPRYDTWTPAAPTCTRVHRREHGRATSPARARAGGSGEGERERRVRNSGTYAWCSQFSLPVLIARVQLNGEEVESRKTRRDVELCEAVSGHHFCSSPSPLHTGFTGRDGCC